MDTSTVTVAIPGFPLFMGVVIMLLSCIVGLIVFEQK
jgi:hypothetical protein